MSYLRPTSESQSGDETGNIPRSEPISSGNDPKRCLDTSFNFLSINFYNIHNLRSNFHSLQHHFTSKPHLLFLNEKCLWVCTVISIPFPPIISILNFNPNCVYSLNIITCYRANNLDSSELSTICLRLMAILLIYMYVLFTNHLTQTTM